MCNSNSGDQILGENHANERGEGNNPFSNSHYQQFKNNRNDGSGDQNNGLTYSQRGFQQLLHFNLASPHLTLVCIMALVVIIALSLGLGLGLGSKQDHNESG